MVHNNDDPPGQALIDFADGIVNNTEPISNVRRGAKAAISVRMALDSMLQSKMIKWEDSYQIS